MNRPIPLVDIFAGPGGLGEGFTSAAQPDSRPRFRIGLSIEKDHAAYLTLRLRALYRLLRQVTKVDLYYEYVRGERPSEAFLAHPHVKRLLVDAEAEARMAELGKIDPAMVDRWISTAIAGNSKWVLVGGPPCQAYSLVGRARRTNDASFENDEKHFLYREYLRILRVHAPPVFVMENVKGLLTSTHGGRPMFSRILEDLSLPGNGIEYEIRSFVYSDKGLGYSAQDYVIESELFGVPQRRHRVILLGVRRDVAQRASRVLTPAPSVTLGQLLHRFPRIRSRLSGAPDSASNWREVVASALRIAENWKHSEKRQTLEVMREALARRGSPSSLGQRFLSHAPVVGALPPTLERWLTDSALGGVLQHESRAHMAPDLQRYFLVASFGRATGASPRLRDFPPALLPKHRNARNRNTPFEDRFRVQLKESPATTITSHIAKDGHYYVHYDPSQCRSLTVREAARAQTFPDNYYFEGNRTQQYTQVGNAVPPFLAMQLAHVVADLLIGA